MQFGRKSEKVQRQIEQLELKLEELEAKRIEPQPEQQPAATNAVPPATQPSRRTLPEHLPREVQTHEPEPQSCPAVKGGVKVDHCGGVKLDQRIVQEIGD